jgi:hypothetical protein
LKSFIFGLVVLTRGCARSLRPKRTGVDTCSKLLKIRKSAGVFEKLSTISMIKGDYISVRDWRRKPTLRCLCVSPSGCTVGSIA